MRIRNTAVAVAALVAGIAIVAPGAPAGGAATPAKASTCDDAETTLAMTKCYSEALLAADNQLRAAYAKARAGTGLSAADRKLLTRSQRTWASFRASDCDFAVAQFRGGSFAPVARLQCRLTQTKRRLADMRGYARRLSGCGMSAAERSRARLRSAC